MFDRLRPPTELEDDVLAFWDSERIFQKVLAQGAGRPRFVFYEGPPTANGTPHNGHVLTRVMKDVFPRYKTMRGFHVDRKAGWDTHGLPVEVEVEKRLGIHGREAITAYGLDKFSKDCVDSVFVYVREWEELTRQIGFWVDLPDAYVTFHKTYVESVWWALSRMFEKGLLYQGHKVVWWWPQGGTTLSAGEVGMGYKEVDDPAVTVRFRDANDPSTSFLAWTTTPWTLPSNVALAVGENIDYAICEDPSRPPQADGLGPAGGTVILAAARAEAYGLVATRVVKGRELVGRRYTPLYDFGPTTPTPKGNDSFVVVAGTHVTVETGTGIVHTAPAFGEDDMAVARDKGLGLLQWLNPDGKFPANTPWAGTFCKDADKLIIGELKDRGLLFKRDTYRHPYPFCWRADSDPLIQYARPAWFIRTTSKVEQALANNAAVGWHPETIREGRFGDFLRNNVDWALSRERFWGTPLNIWGCSRCDHREAPASLAAMQAKPGFKGLDTSVDLHLQVHRPWVDAITWDCAKCGGAMQRVPEVIDCWFDSGCMPFAQWGWPHRGKEAFAQSFPADFISEAVDQTRGWFYSLLMISTLLFDDETCKEFGLSPAGYPRPYRNCIVLGHICDMEGRKESKSKGNYTSPNLVLRGRTRLDAFPDAGLKPGEVGLKPDQVPSLDCGPDDRITITGPGGKLAAKVVKAAVKPKDAVHLHPDDLQALGLPAAGGSIGFATPGEAPGADAFRWLFCASNAPWSNTRISVRAIKEGQREFLIRLRNVYQFFGIYADIAQKNRQFDPSGHAPRPVTERHLLDRWISGRLAGTIAQVTTHMDGWRLYEASLALKAFVEDLSNWYVRRSRERFWNEGTDLEDALWTLYECLLTVSKLIAPFTPFTADAMWRELTAPRAGREPASVHLAKWPEIDEVVDEQLDADMALIRELASLGLSARAAAKLKVRQPLHDVTVILADPSRKAAVAELSGLLTDELNVHRVVFATDASKFVAFQVKPDFKKLGARLGKDMKAVAAALGGMDPLVVKRALDQGGLDVAIDGRTVRLGPDDVVVAIQPKGEFQAASSAAGVVVVSTHIDAALQAEGFVRELVNRVQNLRKELDLGYTQRIALTIDADADSATAIRAHAAYLQRETLARELSFAAAADSRPVEVDGRELKVQVSPL
jgi:isoleucyl-tRNA synthetase